MSALFVLKLQNRNRTTSTCDKKSAEFQPWFYQNLDKLQYWNLNMGRSVDRKPKRRI